MFSKAIFISKPPEQGCQSTIFSDGKNIRGRDFQTQPSNVPVCLEQFFPGDIFFNGKLGKEKLGKDPFFIIIMGNFVTRNSWRGQGFQRTILQIV